MAGHQIMDKMGHRTDLVSFSMSWVMEGYVVKSEVVLPFLHVPASFSISFLHIPMFQPRFQFNFCMFQISFLHVPASFSISFLHVPNLTFACYSLIFNLIFACSKSHFCMFHLRFQFHFCMFQPRFQFHFSMFQI